MFDEPASEEHVVALFGERRASDLLNVDAVRDDFDVLTGGTNGGKPVGRDGRDRYRMLWCACGDVLGELTERSGVTEILLPVVAPDLVPRRYEWCVRAETGEFRGEHREVREDTGDDDVVFVAAEASAELGECAGREVYGFRDGTTVSVVEVGFRGDCAQRHSLMGYLFGAVPEVATIDGDIVALVGESGTDFVDSLLGPTGDERVDDIRHESHAHYPICWV